MQRVLAPAWSSRGTPEHDRRRPRERLSWLRISAFAVALSIHVMAIGWLARSDASPLVGLLAANFPSREMVVDVAVTTPPQHTSAGKSSQVPAAPRGKPSENFRRLPAFGASAPPALAPASSAQPLSGALSESGATAAGMVADGDDGGDGNPGVGGNGTGGQDGGGGDGLTIEKLRPIHAPPPEYPQHALDNSEQGVVILLVRVGANGAPLSARIVKSSGFDELDQITLKKVLAEWRFVAATRNGVKVEALTLARQAFVLH